MKRIVITIMALLSIAVMSSFAFMKNDREAGSLDKLWRKYEKAAKEDRVQDMADLLEDIKTAALNEKAPADYFMACEKYVDVKARRNWKLQDSLTVQARRELHEYGLPVLEILFDLRHHASDDSIKASIRENSLPLRLGGNRELYDDLRLLGYDEVYPVVQKLCPVENDYEYILWMARQNRGLGGGWPYEMLETYYGQEYFGAKYPIEPYVHYLKVNSGFDREEIEPEMKKMAQEYEGRGIGMLAEDDLFGFRFEDMGETASSEEYLKLRDDIKAFDKRRSALKGDDAVLAGLCRTASDVLLQLEDESVEISVGNGIADVAFRNRDKVGMKIKDPENVLYETDVINHVNSFYRKDTVEVAIPELNYGSYLIELYEGKENVHSYMYEKYTVSLASRFAADGMCVYAADYLTGEPLKKADLILYDHDMNKVTEAEDFEFDGFTPLPKKMYPLPGDKAHYLFCRYEKDGIVHTSRRLYLRNQSLGTVSGLVPSLDAVIFKDRGAFVPGETVKFKAVLYRTHSDGTMEVLPAGREVRAELIDPERNKAGKVLLVTNEFGSVSGSFEIDGKGRNGMYRISVYDGASGINAIASSSLRVDEFVLPTYDLAFDEADELRFPGDTVRVTGKVRNFSGHGFGGLKASALIHLNHERLADVPLAIAPDGSFEVEFVAGGSDDRYVSYNVEVRLTDHTGETLEFSSSASLSAEMSLDAELLNRDDGSCWMDAESWRINVKTLWVLSAGDAEFRCRASLLGDEAADVPVDYELRREGKVVYAGKVQSGDTVRLDVSSLDSGIYEFALKAAVKSSTGREIKAEESYEFLYLPENEDIMPCASDRMFRSKYEDGEIVMQLGTGTGPLWAVVELFGEGQVLLKKEMVCLDGNVGKPGSLVTLRFPHSDRYSDNLQLNVFYFRSGYNYRFGRSFRRPVQESLLPLSFASFVDKAMPGQECRVIFGTDPRAEVLASVFDLSSEKIHENLWTPAVFGRGRADVSVSYSYVNGCNGGTLYAIGYGSGKSKGRAARNTGGIYGARIADSADVFINMEEEVVFSKAAAPALSPAGAVIRDDFAATLAFEPFMRPSEDGTVEMKFRTSGKISTFKVMVYAHDKNMANSLISREMVVTLPVKVSVVEPQYLYAGDEYVLKASVSNSSEAALRGTVYFEMYDGEAYLDVEPVRTDSVEVDVPAGGAAAAAFDVAVPSGADMLGFKVVFVGHECASEGIAANETLISDGIFVPVPVHPAAQVLTESHSAVLLEGQSADELLEKLRKEFVNVSSVGAEYKEISIRDMLKEAVPDAVEPDSDDAITLSEAFYVNLLAYGLHDGGWGLPGHEDGPEAAKCVSAAMDSMAKLLKCANGDGGFGWFEDSPSSPMVTAVVLDRYARFRGEDMSYFSDLMGEDALDDLDETIVNAVKYLDKAYFGDWERPRWYGGLSLEQYLCVRSDFSGIPFDADFAKTDSGKKAYREFRKEMRAYLSTASGRDKGRILSKFRLVEIVNNLTQSEEGRELARAWGAPSEKKMLKARKIEVESLKQYAVKHPSGGIYYPNAVMPWRGLLESEVYAHAFIFDVAIRLAFGDSGADWFNIAQGICVWLMLQKETQEWSSGIGFAEALRAVGYGSVPDVRILVLEKRYSKPFPEIKAAGNGFRVSVDYYIDGPAGERLKLSEGDSLHVGDKVTAVYSLWSAENRSYVRLSVPRAACFRPASQLSGWSGGWFRPLRYGFMNVSPYSYREVKADRTLYWIDVFPEEGTVIEETLFVTQEGRFTAPVAEIESLYAPHYRANDGFGGTVTAVSGK